MGLDVQVDTEVPRDRRQLLQQPLGGLQLLMPRHVGAEAVRRVLADERGLVVRHRHPQLAAFDGGARFHHPAKTVQHVAVADLADLRRLRQRVGIDLAHAGLQIHAEGIGPGAHLAQVAEVEIRRHVEDGAEKHAAHAKFPGAFENAHRAPFPGFRHLLAVDS